jgi:hypothetical protein
MKVLRAHAQLSSESPDGLYPLLKTILDLAWMEKVLVRRADALDDVQHGLAGGQMLDDGISKRVLIIAGHQYSARLFQPVLQQLIVALAVQEG